jgi:hypothetical protein
MNIKVLSLDNMKTSRFYLLTIIRIFRLIGYITIEIVFTYKPEYLYVNKTGPQAKARQLPK